MILQSDRGDGPREGFYTDDEQNGVPFIRTNNLVEGALDLSDAKFITRYVHENTLKRTRVGPGDLILACTGDLGATTIIPETVKEANLNSALVRLEIDKTQITQEFFCDFLSCGLARKQISFIGKGAAQHNLNIGEIGEILLPLPLIPKQQELVSELDAARQERARRLADADALLSSLDGFLLDELELEKPSVPDKPFYAVGVADLGPNRRLNPDYFHPERLFAIREQKERTTLDSAPLCDVVHFLRDIAPFDGKAIYMGLANVASNTGQLIDFDEEIGGNCFSFQKNDVLFARLRPYLNKVYKAEFDGICSPEFHVMSIKTDKILPDYLTAILRSSLTLAQTRHMMTGNTHPRLANEDVTNLVIPIPTLEVQKRIADEVKTRRERAQTLRAEADTEWNKAKARFEAALLGE